ncbi:hypothetical protein U1Q18_032593, partial [Sarracenia purpurea var. burkii]
SPPPMHHSRPPIRPVSSMNEVATEQKGDIKKLQESKRRQRCRRTSGDTSEPQIPMVSSANQREEGKMEGAWTLSAWSLESEGHTNHSNLSQAELRLVSTMQIVGQPNLGQIRSFHSLTTPIWLRVVGDDRSQIA